MTEDVIWDALARALAGEYDILARLGFGRGDAPVYLARELVTDNLVALRLPPISSGNDAQEYGLEVVRQIDQTLPEVETRCSHCGRTLHQWARFCTKCGRDISGIAPSTSGKTRDQLRGLARAAAAGKYEVLGEMTRAEGGGLVYFARDYATGRIVGLQLEPGPDSSLVITPTQFAALDATVRLEQPRRSSVTSPPKRISITKELPNLVPPLARVPGLGPFIGGDGQRNLGRLGLILAGVALVVLVALVVMLYRGTRG
jgi:hypothetical protein